MKEENDHSKFVGMNHPNFNEGCKNLDCQQNGQKKRGKMDHDPSIS